jgi:opacity protein-like surface antigen
MKTSRFAGILTLVVLLACAGPLAAQVRVEFGFGWSLVAPTFNSSYVSQFSPPMTGGPYESSAAQTINVKGKLGYGITGMFNLLFAETFGVQLLVDYSRPSLGGANSDYTVTLDYVTFGPRTYTKTDAWPHTRGNFSETTYSFNGLVRLPVAQYLTLNLSGGATSFYLKGKAMPLGYWSFTLENPEPDTYQLSIKTYQLVYDFGPQQKWGFNVGAELAFEVTRNIIVGVDARWYQCGKLEAPMHLVANEGLTDPLDPIETTLGLGSLTINPSFFRACASLRFAF